MIKWLLSIVMVFAALSSAQAQIANQQLCNAYVVYDTTASGTTQLVAPASNGGIFICGYIMGTTGSISANLNYSTGVGGVTTQLSTGIGSVGAVTTKLTPNWNFATSLAGFVQDTAAQYRGAYVPAGNGLNITINSVTASFGAVVYYYRLNQL